MLNNNSITDIQIIPVKAQNGMVGFAELIYEGMYLGSIAIYTLSTGDFRLVYPTRKLKNGTALKTFHPINKEVADAIKDKVVKAYTELVKGEYQEGAV